MILFALTEKYVVVARLAIYLVMWWSRHAAWELAAKPSKLEEIGCDIIFI